MRVFIYEAYKALSEAAAEKIIATLREKPDSLLCLAAGNTPLGTFHELVNAHKRGEVDFSKCSFVGLDEWVGLGCEDEGSCYYTLYHHLFEPIGIHEHQVRFFNSKAFDLHEECNQLNTFIEEKGGIDFMLLGIGLNGHLGFNEPGVDFSLRAHVIDLDETTQTVGQKYFSEKKTLKQGITLGIQTILEAKSVILLADGEKKASIVKETVEREVTNEIPATALKLHPNAVFMVDKEAASKLS